MIGLDTGPRVGRLERGLSRRTFLKLCAALTAVLALPPAYASRVAAAVSSAPRLPVIWLRGQGCGGESEAFLGAAEPGFAALLLDLLSIDYFEDLMAATGEGAEAARTATLRQYPGVYLAIVEGAIPASDRGVYMTVGGHSFAELVREVAAGAVATIGLGSCAFDGGLSAAAGGATGSTGVGSVASGSPFVSLPGCPVNVENLTATIVHYLTFKEMPATDGRGRPLFAYGGLVHNQCERRPHFEFGEFVQAWGDEGAQKGWCLYKMGCKGPQTFANCASVRFGEGTSWPVEVGSPCIGCTMPGFWDSMSPFARRLPSPVPFAPELTADQVGLAAIAGVGGLAAVHGAASIARSRLRRRPTAPGRVPEDLRAVLAPEILSPAAPTSAVVEPAVEAVVPPADIPVADRRPAEVPESPSPDPTPPADDEWPALTTAPDGPGSDEPATAPSDAPDSAAAPADGPSDGEA